MLLMMMTLSLTAIFLVWMVIVIFLYLSQKRSLCSGRVRVSVMCDGWIVDQIKRVEIAIHHPVM